MKAHKREQFRDTGQEVRLGQWYKGFDVRLRSIGSSYRQWRDVESFQLGTWGNEVYDTIKGELGSFNPTGINSSAHL